MINDDVAIVINNTINVIDGIIYSTVPKELTVLATEIFDSKGTTHGRNWEDNTPSTAKRKGKNHRNVDTGNLATILTTEGFLLDENYIDKLPTPVSGSDDGYLYANILAPFDDIGQTEDDINWVRLKIIKAIQDEFE